MKIRLLIATFVLVGIITIPNTARAFDVTDTSAIRLTPNHVLLTVTYEFGFLNRELLMPVMADRTSERRGTTVGYTLTGSNGEVITAGDTAAIVLSTTELRDDQYYLPRGRNGDFTLVALVRTAGISEDFKLSLTRLPFTLIDGTVTATAAVTAAQLEADYQTDLVR
jgi:hypothetical protein